MTNNADNFSNPISVATGGTGLSSMVTFAPLVGGTGSTTAIQQATTGLATSGNVLKSRGASTLPAWMPYSSLIELSSQTVSGAAAVNFNNTYITSTYTKYLIIYKNLVLSANDNVELLISTNNGTSMVATGYQSGANGNAYSSPGYGNTPATTFCILSYPFGVSIVANGELYLNIPTSASFSFVAQSITVASNGTADYYAYGNNSSTTTVNYIRIQPGSGTLTGTITLYGIAS